MPEERSFAVTGEGGRLDRFIAEKLSPMSRTQVQRLIKEGLVLVNGLPATSRLLVKAGDRVRAALPDFSSLPASAAASVPVLYEDGFLIAVNKPAGLVVHPAGPHRDDTLIQRLWPKLSTAWSGAVKRERGLRPGVVHRLDRGTSGVMVLAKTPAAADHLSRQFAERTVEKIYRAAVWGVPRAPAGRIRSVVGRSRRQPHRMSVEGQGRWSETEFRVLESFPAAGFGRGAALLEIHPLTGRTHQIRVQLAALGHPLVGDRIYGDPDDDAAGRPLLHAARLAVDHPDTGRRLAWTAPPPKDFESALRALSGVKKKK